MIQWTSKEESFGFLIRDFTGKRERGENDENRY